MSDQRFFKAGNKAFASRRMRLEDYFRGVRNLMLEYSAACSSCVCFRNWGDETGEIVHQNGTCRDVVDVDSFQRMTHASGTIMEIVNPTSELGAGLTALGLRFRFLQ